jgi:hypothetical protein
MAGISELAQALSCGSAKLCEAMALVFDEQDQRRSRADQINLQLQSLALDLNGDANAPSTRLN